MEFEPMSPEEIQRTMQFLLQQQAQFAAGFERLSAKADRMMDAIVGLTAVTGQTVGIVGRLAEGQERLREAQERTDEQLRRTEANLDALINMFERHLREDHGRPPS